MSADWTHLNAEGLTLADRKQWADATRAFEQALAVVEGLDADSTVTLVAHDDIRARLLLNIGQCHFHTRSFEESRRFAERSCALRVSLYGEHSLVVARTRGDLAVILAASGHTDEAMSLLERAVSAVERKRGAASAHLLPLLTNAARLLARATPERAQPYVARLKALLFAQQQADNAEIFPPSDVPAHSFSTAPGSTGSDDHLLRAAIAETVDLLRSTPAANIAMQGVRKAEGVKGAEVAGINGLLEATEIVERVGTEQAAETSETDQSCAVPIITRAGSAPPSAATGSTTEVEQNALVHIGIYVDTVSDIPAHEVITSEIPLSEVVTSEFLVGEFVTAHVPDEDASQSELFVDEAVTAEIPVDPYSFAEIHVDRVTPSETHVDRAAEMVVHNDAEITVAWEYEVPPPITLAKAMRVVTKHKQLDGTIFDLVEPPPPTLSELPKRLANAGHSANPNPLGFQVEYGIPSQSHESFANPTVPLPTNPKGDAISEADFVERSQANRNGMRAVGGVRRGSTQVVAMKRLWMIGASIAAFGGGVGAVLLYRYFNQLAR